MAETLAITIPLHLQTQQAQQELEAFRRSAAASDPNFKPLVSPSQSMAASGQVATGVQGVENQQLLQNFGGNQEVQNVLRDSTLAAADRMKKLSEVSEKLIKEFELYTNMLRMNNQEEQNHINQHAIKDQQDKEDEKTKTEDAKSLKNVMGWLKQFGNLGKTWSSGELRKTQSLVQGDVLGAAISDIDTKADLTSGFASLFGGVLEAVIPGGEIIGP